VRHLLPAGGGCPGRLTPGRPGQSSPAQPPVFSRRAMRQGLPSPKPRGRQPWGICSLAPGAVKVARRVRGRAGRVIVALARCSKPLQFSSSILEASALRAGPSGGVRSGNGIWEEMPRWPGRSERWCKPTPGDAGNCVTSAGDDGDPCRVTPCVGFTGKRLEESVALKVTGVAPLSRKPRSVAQTSNAPAKVLSGQSERPPLGGR
jgi:hypothetical protein